MSPAVNRRPNQQRPVNGATAARFTGRGFSSRAIDRPAPHREKTSRLVLPHLIFKGHKRVTTSQFLSHRW
jgi:hypothetical protein